MTDLKLSPRIGFAFFAGWNAIPLLKRDLGIIEKAHAVRFAGRRQSFQEYLKTAVVLLAGAVRHGERVTLSMAAWGIECAQNRTFIEQILWTKTDTLYTVLGCAIALTAGIARVLSGTFIFELG
jgi:energy-coupling factor transport system permease protein